MQMYKGALWNSDIKSGKQVQHLNAAAKRLQRLTGELALRGSTQKCSKLSQRPGRLITAAHNANVQEFPLGLGNLTSENSSKETVVYVMRDYLERLSRSMQHTHTWSPHHCCLHILHIIRGRPCNPVNTPGKQTSSSQQQEMRCP